MGLQLSRLSPRHGNLGRLKIIILPLLLFLVARRREVWQRWCDHWRRSRARRLRVNGLSLLAFESTTPDPFVRLKGGRDEFEELYELCQRLTESTYGCLYECRLHASPQESLVVKIVPKAKHPLLRAANQGRKRVCGKRWQGEVAEAEEFRRYMATLLRLQHCNIVRYLQFFADSTSFYFVMENCEGRTLIEHLLAEGVWREAAVQPLMSQLLEALKYVHNLRLTHRDVKPENLMISPVEGALRSRAAGSACASSTSSVRLRLLDFGLGCLATVASGIVGTPGYIAPEVYHLERYGCSADLFSAGVVFFILLTGRPPFRAPITPRHLTEHIEALLSGPNFQEAPLPFVGEDGRDLLDWMLLPQACARCTAAEGLRHNWFQRRSQRHSQQVELPVLWKSSNSELRFLKVMGVWSGSASRSQVVVDNAFEALEPISESGEGETESSLEVRSSSNFSRQSSGVSSAGGQEHELPMGFKRDALLEELCSGLLRHLEISVCLADPTLFDCPLVAVSRGFEVLTGYVEKRCVGRNCRFLRVAEVQEEIQSRLRSTVSNMTTFVGVLPNVRADGTPFENLLHISPLEIGSKKYLVGVQTEVEGSGLDDESGQRMEEILGVARKVHAMIRQWLRGGREASPHKPAGHSCWGNAPSLMEAGLCSSSEDRSEGSQLL